MARSTAFLPVRARRERLAASLAGLAAGVLAAAEAGAEPIRIDYQAAEGCPGVEVFLDEIRWRTTLARLAAPHEDALEVRASIERRGAVNVGHLVLDTGKDRVAREIRSASCDEVVSALALVTALAVDPRALTSAKPPPSAPPAAPAPAPPASEPPPAGEPAPPPRAPQILADPLPALLSPPAAAPLPAPGRWELGAGASLAFAVTPRPLFGGGLFAERAFGGRWGAAVRLSLELAGTGDVDVGPGAASFLRGVGRVQGCAFVVRPARWLSFLPCVGVEGGALHATGILGGSLTHTEQVTVPWLGAGVLPRVAVDLGPVALEAQGGPDLPLVRRTFVFESPSYVVYAVPSLTWTAWFGVAVHFS